MTTESKTESKADAAASEATPERNDGELAYRPDYATGFKRTSLSAILI